MRFLVDLEDGGPAAYLDECIWLGYDPDGHCIRIMDGSEATSAMKCHKEFVSTQVQRAREVRLGYTFTLVRRHSAASDAAYKCHRSECEHVTHQPTLPLEGQ